MTSGSTFCTQNPLRTFFTKKLYNKQMLFKTLIKSPNGSHTIYFYGNHMISIFPSLKLYERRFYCKEIKSRSHRVTHGLFTYKFVGKMKTQQRLLLLFFSIFLVRILRVVVFNKSCRSVNSTFLFQKFLCCQKLLLKHSNLFIAAESFGRIFVRPRAENGILYQIPLQNK